MDGFIGEIRAFPFAFTPRQWLPCDGTTYNSEITRDLVYLFHVIGKKFGGNPNDGTFSVPNLQGRVGIGAGQVHGGTNYNLGDTGGVIDITLQNNQMPPHTHTAYGLVTTATESAPLKEVSVPNSSCYLSNIYEVPPPTIKRQGNFYFPNLAAAILDSHTLSGFQGGGGPHSNMQSYLVMTWCICYDGAWPPRPGQTEKPVNPQL